jgi:hypothetical protein
MGLQVATHNRTRYSQLFSLFSCRDEGKEAKETNTKGKQQQQQHQSDFGRFLKFYFKQTKKTREKTTGSFKSSSILVGCRKCTDMRERETTTITMSPRNCFHDDKR